MTTIDRVRISWTGFPGAPGVSTMYFLDGPGAQGALKTFFSQLMNGAPANVTVHVEKDGDTIVAETGVLSGTWVGTDEGSDTGTTTNAHSGAAGYCYRWDTGAVVFGHRLRGRTYNVPASAAAFQSDGSIDPGVISGETAAGQALIDSTPGNMVVWSRPRVATPAWTDVRGRVHPAVAARAGYAAPVITCKVPDLAVVLRSRRD